MTIVTIRTETQPDGHRQSRLEQFKNAIIIFSLLLGRELSSEAAQLRRSKDVELSAGRFSLAPCGDWVAYPT